MDFTANLIGNHVYKGMKKDLKPDEYISWVNLGSGTVPITLKKGCIRLYCENMLKKVSMLGLRYKIRKRVK
jgi:hypothetical protein